VALSCARYVRANACEQHGYTLVGGLLVIDTRGTIKARLMAAHTTLLGEHLAMLLAVGVEDRQLPSAPLVEQLAILHQILGPLKIHMALAMGVWECCCTRQIGRYGMGWMGWDGLVGLGTRAR